MLKFFSKILWMYEGKRLDQSYTILIIYKKQIKLEEKGRRGLINACMYF